MAQSRVGFADAATLTCTGNRKRRVHGVVPVGPGLPGLQVTPGGAEQFLDQRGLRRPLVLRTAIGPADQPLQQGGFVGAVPERVIVVRPERPQHSFRNECVLKLLHACPRHRDRPGTGGPLPVA